MNNWKSWLHSLIAAVIGGVANSITAMFVAPETFNLQDLGKLGKLAAGSAIISLMFFLKKSPLPDSALDKPTRPDDIPFGGAHLIFFAFSFASAIRIAALCSAVAMIALLGSGCKSRAPRGEIRSFTQRVVGIDASENPATQTPQLRLGFVSTTYSVVPTSTNAIYAPPVSDSINLDHKPLSTHIEEQFSTGNAATNAPPPK